MFYHYLLLHRRYKKKTETERCPIFHEMRERKIYVQNIEKYAERIL